VFVVEIKDDAPNKRVGSRAGQCFMSEPSGSGFSWWFWRDRSDPAAHAKH
jgi:hypothetical protein